MSTKLKRKKLTLNTRQKVPIASSSSLSVQEKENIKNYQKDNKENAFNTPSPIHRIFQNLPQIPVTELMDMEIYDALNKKKGIAFLYKLKFKYKILIKLITFFTIRVLLYIISLS